MPSQPRMRPMVPRDQPGVLAMNQAEVPAVGHLESPELSALVGQCAHAWVVESQGRLAGFVLALLPGSAYTSPNYLWFTQRYERILYVDRIAIAPWARGRGLGRALYLALAELDLPIGCEVNTRPMNQESLDFHQKLGFVPVGDGDARGKGVRYLLRDPAHSPLRRSMNCQSSV